MGINQKVKYCLIKKIRMLTVMDSEDDMLLLMTELRNEGYKIIFERVETATAMNIALNKHAWDIVLADNSLTKFTGFEAFDLLKEREQDIQFIMVSDVISEETAIKIMKAGMYDYILKNNLLRLISIIE